MEPMYYIGLDVHKRKLSYCVKDASGQLHAEGSIPASRPDLDCWMKTLPQPCTVAMEATMFTGWIYDHLKPYALTKSTILRRVRYNLTDLSAPHVDAPSSGRIAPFAPSHLIGTIG